MGKQTVGLITYVNAGNYGAALQLFATYTAIKECGFDPILVNYENEYEAGQRSLRFLLRNDSLKEKLRILISRYIFFAAHNGKRNFNEFYEKLFEKSARVKYVKDIAFLNFDVYCVGSDQVWNPIITNGYDDVFTLNSPAIHHKISFSSSMGSLNHDKSIDQKLKKSLSDFSFLSVREKSTKQYLSDLLGQDVALTVDPTLLFDQHEWEKRLCLDAVSTRIQEDYVLIYALSEFNELNKEAKKIAGLLNVKVACITLSSRRKDVDYLIDYATPEVFVKAIKNARYVITNSFHGTCFSIINKIPFFSMKFNSNPKRVENLVKQYDLCDRFISGTLTEAQIWEGLNTMDIVMANRKIKADAKKSMEWLKGAIVDA